MPKVTNISSGPRGAYNKGVLVMAEPGETIEADDFAKEWFKGGKSDADADDGKQPEKPLAKMNKTELQAAAADAGVTVAHDDEGKEVPLEEATNKQLIAAIEKAQPPA